MISYQTTFSESKLIFCFMFELQRASPPIIIVHINDHSRPSPNRLCVAPAPPPCSPCRPCACLLAAAAVVPVPLSAPMWSRCRSCIHTSAIFYAISVGLLRHPPLQLAAHEQPHQRSRITHVPCARSFKQQAGCHRAICSSSAAAPRRLVAPRPACPRQGPGLRVIRVSAEGAKKSARECGVGEG